MTKKHQETSWDLGDKSRNKTLIGKGHEIVNALDREGDYAFFPLSQMRTIQREVKARSGNQVFIVGTIRRRGKITLKSNNYKEKSINIGIGKQKNVINSLTERIALANNERDSFKNQNQKLIKILFYVKSQLSEELAAWLESVIEDYENHS